MTTPSEIMTIGELIDSAFGDPEKNVVHFKLIQAILFLLARQLRLLDRRVKIELIASADFYSSESSIVVSEVKIQANVKKRKHRGTSITGRGQRSPSRGGGPLAGSKPGIGKGPGGATKAVRTSTVGNRASTGGSRVSTTPRKSLKSDSGRALATPSGRESSASPRGKVVTTSSGRELTASPSGKILTTASGRELTATDVTDFNISSAGDQSSSLKSSTEKSSTEKSSTEKSSTEKSSTAKSSTDKSSTEKSSTEKSSTEKSSTEKSSTEKSSTEKSSTEKSSTEKSSTVSPTDKSSTEKSSTEKSSTVSPTDKSSTEKSSTEKSSTVSPTDKLSTEKSSTEKSSTVSPTDKSSTEKSSTEKSSTGKSFTDKLSTEKSSTEKSSTGKSFTDKLSTEKSSTVLPTDKSSTEKSSTVSPTDKSSIEKSSTEKSSTVSPTDKSSTEKSSTEKSATVSPTDKSSTEKSANDILPTDKSPTYISSTDKSSVDKSSTEKSTTDKSFTEKAGTDKSSNKLGTDESSTDKSEPDKSSTEKSGTDKSSTLKSSTDKSSLDKLSPDRKTSLHKVSTDKITTGLTSQKASAVKPMEKAETHSERSSSSDKISTEKSSIEKSTDKSSTTKYSTEKSSIAKYSTDKKTPDKPYTETGSTSKSTEKGSTDKSTEKGSTDKSTEKGSTDKSTEKGSTYKSKEKSSTDKSSEKGSIGSTNKGSTDKSSEKGSTDKSSAEKGSAYKSTADKSSTEKKSPSKTPTTYSDKTISGKTTTGTSSQKHESRFRGGPSDYEVYREQELRTIHQRTDSREEHDKTPTPMASMDSFEVQYEKLLVVERVPSEEARARTSRLQGEQRGAAPRLSIVTQEEFTQLAKKVKLLQAKFDPTGMAQFPENIQLMQELRKGASLTDAMAALQLSARLEATEKALERMMSIVTDLASKYPNVDMTDITKIEPETEVLYKGGIKGPTAKKPGASKGLKSTAGGLGQATAVTRGVTTPESVVGQGKGVQGAGGAGVMTGGGAGGGVGDGTGGGAGVGTGDGSGAGADEDELEFIDEMEDAEDQVKKIEPPVTPKEATVNPDWITGEELDTRLQELYDGLYNSLDVLIAKNKTNADAALKTANRLDIKLMAAMDLGERMSDLESSVATYAEQINILDAGLSSQMTHYQEELTQMQHDLETGLENMAEALASVGGETTAVAELNCHFTNLQSDFETTNSRQNELQDIQTTLRIDLDDLRREIELLRGTKSDRDEVTDALRDKVGLGTLNGLVSVEQFDAVRGDLEQRIGAAYDKFNNQELTWQKAIDDLMRELGEKADWAQVNCLKDDIALNIEKLRKKLKDMLDIVGEPQAAAVSKKLHRDTRCLSCSVPANLKWEKEDMIPMLSAMPGARPPTLGAESTEKIVDDGACYTGYPITHAIDPRAHVCNRYCGGSHTKIPAKLSRVPPGMLINPAMRDPSINTNANVVRKPCLPCNVKTKPKTEKTQKPSKERDSIDKEEENERDSDMTPEDFRMMSMTMGAAGDDNTPIDVTPPADVDID